MSGLTSAGAVLDLVVEKLGDEDQVCEDVEHDCDYLRKETRNKEGHNPVKILTQIQQNKHIYVNNLQQNKSLSPAGLTCEFQE